MAEPRLTIPLLSQILAFVIGTVGIVFAVDSRIDSKIETSFERLHLPQTYIGKVELVEKVAELNLQISSMRAELQALRKDLEHLNAAKRVSP